MAKRERERKTPEFEAESGDRAEDVHLCRYHRLATRTNLKVIVSHKEPGAPVRSNDGYPANVSDMLTSEKNRSGPAPLGRRYDWLRGARGTGGQ